LIWERIFVLCSDTRSLDVPITDGISLLDNHLKAWTPQSFHLDLEGPRFVMHNHRWGDHLYAATIAMCPQSVLAGFAGVEMKHGRPGSVLLEVELLE